jgi:DNA replication protein DnaC
VGTVKKSMEASCLAMRRQEGATSLLTSNRHIEDWGRLLGISAAVTAMLDRLLRNGHI